MKPIRADNLGSIYFVERFGKKCFCGKAWSDSGPCGDPEFSEEVYPRAWKNRFGLRDGKRQEARRLP